MISDKELLDLNQRGFFPGVGEEEEAFCRRVEVCEIFFHNPGQFFENLGEKPPFSLATPVQRHHWDLKRAELKRLFDFSPDWLPAFYQSKGLAFWHGAMTWIFTSQEKKAKFALLQFRASLKKGSYLGFYQLDEMMAHEAVHAARMAFEEPVYEELFSYLTSSRRLGRVLGPIVKRRYEMTLFILFLSTGLLFQFLEFFLAAKLLYTCTWGWLLLGCSRLFKVHRSFNKAHKNLFSLVKERTFFVLLRLSDQEIRHFSKISSQEILQFSEKESSLRWRLLRLAYFQERPS